MNGPSIIDNRISIGKGRSEHLEVSAIMRDIRLDESYEVDGQGYEQTGGLAEETAEMIDNYD